MNTRQANLVKKWLPCLKCGKLLWTDRCHRVCAECSRANDPAPPRSDTSGTVATEEQSP